MSPPAQTLRDLIDIALKKQDTKSIRSLATIGQQAGYKITQPTLWGIHSGRYRSEPKPPTLEAIAYLAGVPLKQAYAAAMEDPGVPFKPAPGADKLTPRERDVVNSVIRALLEAREKPSAYSDQANEDHERVSRDGGHLAVLTDSAFHDSEGLPQSSEAT